MSADAERILNAEPVAERPPVCWREPTFWTLVLFVLAAYFTRLSDLPIRGEESRRGLIAREMLATGDWVIPRTQGVPLFSRPPLQNWLIAGLALVRGDVDAVALRLPSVCAVLATCVILYRYARSFLGPLGALASGLAFAGMGQVLELGRVGETDALFTLFVSGALLTWHGGLRRADPPWRFWCAGYTLAALGTLTKGPQAPVYFVAPVMAYLVATRQWRTLFCRGHLAGLAAFTGLMALWQVPCLARVGLEGVRKMYVSDVGHRFLDANWFAFGEHLAVYPLETLACLLPWSALLIVWCNRGFRRTLGALRDPALFLAICVSVSFPTVWLPPGSRPRYFMSLYPCLAVLIGIGVERVATARRDQEWRIVWPLFVRIASAVLVAAAVGLLAVSLGDFGLWFAQPAGTATGVCAAVGLLAVAAWRSVGRASPRAPQVAVLSIAGGVALLHVVVMINALKSTSVDVAAEIAALKRQLPPGTQLVSFHVTHHLFTYHYRDEIPVVPWPETAADEPARVRYFCADGREFEGRSIPFPWTRIAEISCDRHRLPSMRQKVVIGRREDLPDPSPPAPSPLAQGAGRGSERR